MDKAKLLETLRVLYAGRRVVEDHGPNSPEGSSWIAEAHAHVRLADALIGVQFGSGIPYLSLSLSTQLLASTWNQMQAALRSAIVKLEYELPSEPGKVYAGGDAFELYRDLSQIISVAQREVFVIDPYASDEVFTLYFAKVTNTARSRLLTHPPTDALRAVARKFAAGDKRGPFEARHTTAVHDRVVVIDDRDCWVLGQSLKDAAMKKPTYLVPVAAVSDMVRLYEDAWSSATPF
jgi:hypothetical protein